MAKLDSGSIILVLVIILVFLLVILGMITKCSTTLSKFTEEVTTVSTS